MGREEGIQVRRGLFVVANSAISKYNDGAPVARRSHQVVVHVGVLPVGSGDDDQIGVCTRYVLPHTAVPSRRSHNFRSVKGCSQVGCIGCSAQADDATKQLRGAKVAITSRCLGCQACHGNLVDLVDLAKPVGVRCSPLRVHRDNFAVVEVKGRAEITRTCLRDFWIQREDYAPIVHTLLEGARRDHVDVVLDSLPFACIDTSRCTRLLVVDHCSRELDLGVQGVELTIGPDKSTTVGVPSIMRFLGGEGGWVDVGNEVPLLASGEEGVQLVVWRLERPEDHGHILVDYYNRWLSVSLCF